jgi:hypothetical protein
LLLTVVASIISWLSHGVLMAGMYAKMPLIWRPFPAMTSLLPYGYFATFISMLCLVYIYGKGYEGKPSRFIEGLRFGVIVGLFAAVPMSVWSYISIPMPKEMAMSWFLAAFAEMAVVGVVLGLVYKKKEV